jgi:hypothetical protein
MAKRVIAKKTRPKVEKDSFRGKDSFIMEKQHAPEKYQSKQSIKGTFSFCVYSRLHVCDNLRQRTLAQTGLE